MPYCIALLREPARSLARRGAWGARTVRATAAAVGPGAARRGAWGARTVRATADAVGPGAARRGAWGGHGLGEGKGGVLNVIKDELSRPWSCNKTLIDQRGLGRPHREGHRRRRGTWGRPRGLGGGEGGEGYKLGGDTNWEEEREE